MNLRWKQRSLFEICKTIALREMKTLNNLKNLLERIAKLKILVIGDLMLDRYIFGDAHRISPEAPVPVVDVAQEKETLGAAGNVSLNLRSIGASVEVLGTFGQDSYGKYLGHLLSTHGIRWHPSCRRKEVRTILKTRIVVRNQQLCRLDIEDRPKLYHLEKNTYLETLLANVNRYNGIIFSDYAKGTITQWVADEIIKAAKAHHVIVTVDPKPKSDVQFWGMDLLKPNKSEALEMLGMNNIRDAFNPEAVCHRLFSKYHPKSLVITLGQEGMLIAENGKILEQIPSDAREVFDVSGAGDTA
ncbi:MAG: PfkB family carbohydrate kinase, partial [Puniceicoccales bacterium]|nr:PfkB family carbohydrate kinase [Puniceicoccales bacterium]